MPDPSNALAQALPAPKVGDIVTGTVASVEEDRVRLDVGGVVGVVEAGELPLAGEESPADRYAVGDSVEAFVISLNRKQGSARLSVRRAAPGYVDKLAARELGEIVEGVITRVEEDGIWLDVDGAISRMKPYELPLTSDETLADRYGKGDLVNAFVWEINLDSRHLGCSILRTMDGFVDALNTLNAGDTALAVVISVQSDRLAVDLNSVFNWISEDELPLAAREVPADRYSVGDTVKVLVTGVSDILTDVPLRCSVRRAADDYAVALQALSFDDKVEGIVMSIDSNGIIVDINSIRCAIPEDELPLLAREAPADHYSVGDTVTALVRDVDDNILDYSIAEGFPLDHFPLDCSIRRATGEYQMARDALVIGDILDGIILQISEEYLIVDVSNMRFEVKAWETPSPDGELLANQYSIGEIIQIRATGYDYATRSPDGLRGSIRRASEPDPIESFETDQRIEGTVTALMKHNGSVDGIYLEANNLIGYIESESIPLFANEPVDNRYSKGDSMPAIIKSVYRNSISKHFIATPMVLYALAKPFTSHWKMANIIEGAVVSVRERGVDLDVDGQIGWIPATELFLDEGERPSDKYAIGDHLKARVCQFDQSRQALMLSIRRIEGWEEALERLSPGTIVPDAQISSATYLPEDEHRAAVDLSPIIGFIREDELDLDAAAVMMRDEANTQIGVVIESIEDGFAIVSREKYNDRWRELAAQFEVGSELDAELRKISHNLAYVDLGSGLLAAIPSAQITVSHGAGNSQSDLIGEIIPVHITSINNTKNHIIVEHRDQWLEALIGEPESQTLEFKEVLKGDKAVDDAKGITRKIIGTICAFLNTDGGKLIIGINDASREVGGLEADQGLKGETIEEKIDKATQLLHDNLGNCEAVNRLQAFDYGTVVTWTTTTVRGKTVLAITCDRGPEDGVFSKIVKGKPQFWARQGASTVQLLTIDEWNDHLERRKQRAAEENTSS